MTANKKRTFRRVSSCNFGCKKKALRDFLASSSSWKIAHTGKPAYDINLQGCLYAEAYMTQDFQRHFNLNTCLREWKLLSLWMLHLILFLLSCNFLKSLCRSFSVEHEHRLQEYSKCRAYQTHYIGDFGNFSTFSLKAHYYPAYHIGADCSYWTVPTLWNSLHENVL